MSAMQARGWRTWTLTRQLVVGVSAVVMLVLLAVGVLSVLTLRGSLGRVIDTQLTASADGFSYGVTKFRITPTASGDKPPPGAMKPLTEVVGQAPGNVIALIQPARWLIRPTSVTARPARHPTRSWRKSPSWHGTEGGSGPSNSPDSASTGWRAGPETGTRYS